MSLRQKVRLIALFRFCDAFRLSAAILIIYFARVSGSYALGMSVFSITSISQLIFDVPTGMLSDARGRRPVIVGGAIAGLAFTACYAVGLNYWYLFVGGAAEGLARALYSGTLSALLYETLLEHGVEDRYPEYSGKISSLAPAAYAVATIAGSVIAAYSLHLVFWLTLVPQTAALGTAFLLYEPKVIIRRGGMGLGDLREAAREFVHNRRLGMLTLATASREAIGESGFQYRPAFFNTLWPLWALGIAGTLTELFAAASFFVAGRVIARYQALRVVVADVVIGRVINVVALVFPTVASPALMSCTSLTYGLGEVATDTLLQREFSDRQRATMGSVSSQVMNVMFAVAAVLVGLVADRIGPVKTLLLLQALVLLPLSLYWQVFVHRAPTERAS